MAHFFILFFVGFCIHIFIHGGIFPGLFQELVPAGSPPVILVSEFIFLIVVLVVRFGLVKNIKLCNRGHNGFVKHLGCIQGLFGCQGLFFLHLIVVKNLGPVLGPSIHKLPSGIRGIDVAPEDIQQFIIGHDPGIIVNLDGLGMAGAPGGDL